MKSYQRKMIAKSMDNQKKNQAKNLETGDRVNNYNRKAKFSDYVKNLLLMVILDFFFIGVHFLIFDSVSSTLIIVLGALNLFDIGLLWINKSIKSTFLRYLYFIFHSGFFVMVNFVFLGFVYSTIGAYFYYYYFIVFIGFFLLYVPYMMSIEKCEEWLKRIKMQPENHANMSGEEELDATMKTKSFKWMYYPLIIAFALPWTRWIGILGFYAYLMLFVSFQMRITSKKFKDQKEGKLPLDDFESQVMQTNMEALEELEKLEELEIPESKE